MSSIHDPDLARKIYHGLLTLLTYARTHNHSRQWIGAIATLLTREARAHG